MKRLFILTLSFVLFYAAVSPALAQEQATQQPTAEELEKQKAEREKNAYRLLDQVIDEAQSLRLMENRVRVQINAADVLWDKNQGRARTLFTMAADGIAEIVRNPPTINNRQNPGQNQDRRAFQLRQELVLAAAKHDAQLAYQLLATTKPAVPVSQNTNEQRGPRPMVDPEDNLEQQLLGRIAALDPKLAAQNAEQMMEKGQFPRSVMEVITRLSQQDPEAGAKLADKTVKRIQASNILTNNEAAVLAQVMLNSGIRQPTQGTASANQLPVGVPVRGPVLEQAAYVELLSSMIDAALKVTPPTQNNQQRPATAGNPQRGRAQLPNPQSPVVVNRPGGPTQEQTEQNNARRLLASIMIAMPVIEQQLPSKAPAVRQKLAEMGVGNLANMSQPAVFSGAGAPTTDALIQAAATAPPQAQTRLYQQAAFRALEEGNADRARQIATDHLPANTRDSVLQRIEFRELVKKADGARFEEIRQSVNRLQSDNEKIEMLIQLAGDAQKTNQKLAIQLLDEARQITNRRATSYDQFNQQLRVAHAFVAADTARSFEVFEPVIIHLNELLNAASILNGFELNMFRDGEMTMQGGSALTTTISRVGQELANLARTDFERADTLAGRFQLTEPRIMTRILIIQGLLAPPRPDRPTGPIPVNVGRVGQTVNVRPE